MTRSVLRLADQTRDVFPDRCVLSGVETTGAARVTAVAWGGHRWLLFVPGVVAVLAYGLRRRRTRVAIPVSSAVWTRWRRRVVWSQGAAAFGGVMFVIGAAAGGSAPIAGGLLTLVSAIALWARANRNWWITCVLVSARSVVIVEPTHRHFDAAAREIFVTS